MPHLKLNSPSVPACPACGQPLVPVEREPKRRESVANLRVGSPMPPRHALRVWHCPLCRIDRPRI